MSEHRRWTWRHPGDLATEEESHASAGKFLSLAISAVWLAATSSAGLRPGYGANRFAGDATGDVDNSTADPDGSGIVNMSQAIHTMTLAECENAPRARRLG
jgi:hypothetical protein